MDVYLSASILVGALLLIALHVVTAGLTLWRVCRPLKESRLSAERPCVSIIRPVSGLTTEDEIALRSTFFLDYANFEIIICAEHEHDPAVRFCRDLIAQYHAVSARVLVGRERVSANPKLDNIEKGWSAARHPWVIMADCNVLMPTDYIQTMLAGWRDNCGLVCAPPVGTEASNLWAALECAFLNTYQARWQYASDSIGLGFGQGKSMLWNRSFLEKQGGLKALEIETAEDAAATKIVRAKGLRVCLANRPSLQPIGLRDFNRVLSRQLRWAQLRRHSFPIEFALEPVTSGVVVISALAAAAWFLGLPAFETLIAGAAVWYGIEAFLAWRSSWPMSWTAPIAWLLRDILIPIIWGTAWVRQSYVWNGKQVVLSTVKPAPLGEPS